MIETRRYMARLNWDGLCMGQREMLVRLTEDIPGACRISIRHDGEKRFRTPRTFRGQRIVGSISEVWPKLERLESFGPRLDTLAKNGG